MGIRFATLTDVPALVEGGQRTHSLTRFRSQPYNAAKVSKVFTDIVQSGSTKYALMVAESQGRIVGALMAVVEQQIFSDEWTASIMHIDVLPEARMGGWAVRLLKAFEQWAKNRGVVELGFGINSEDDMQRIGKFAVRTGYRKVGENYVRGV